MVCENSIFVKRFKKKTKQIEEVVDKLSNKYGRIPTEDEIANELGLTLEKHRAISLQPSAKMILSLEHGNISRDIGLRDYFLDKNVTSPESVAITGQKSERLKKRYHNFLKDRKR